VNDAVRRRLADGWLQAALAEHASVASFARFTLQLLAIGAPADLVEAAQRAGLDEVDHARRSFRLASRYAGTPLGPGPLPLHGDLLGPLDLAALAAAATREGCVGETLSALEAAEALEGATDPEVREALAAIAADEARHAELSWAFVRWCLGVAPVHAAVRRALEEALAAQVPVPPTDPDEATLRAHGRLSDRCRARVHARGLAEVVGPAARALLDG
jgi:hypothetical protein